jgi:elongation factor Ts
MSTITTEQVKDLREQTGISVMQCRKALEEAGGDMNKALAILKKNSSEIAQKKLSREVKDGRVAIRSADDKAVLVALLCETDFVAKNDDFVNLLEQLTEKAFVEGTELMKAGAKDMIEPIVQKTGENIQLGEVYEVKGGVMASYLHNNKIGVIVSLEGGNKDLARDVAMHIAAMKPEYIFEEEIPEDAKNTVREIFEKEVAQSDKPEEVKQKMLQGKMNAYFSEKTLGSQAFIKDGNITVGKLLEQNNAKIKEVKRFAI